MLVNTPVDTSVPSVWPRHGSRLNWTVTGWSIRINRTVDSTRRQKKKTRGCGQQPSTVSSLSRQKPLKPLQNEKNTWKLHYLLLRPAATPLQASFGRGGGITVRSRGCCGNLFYLLRSYASVSVSFPFGDLRLESRATTRPTPPADHLRADLGCQSQQVNH